MPVDVNLVADRLQGYLMANFNYRQPNVYHFGKLIYAKRKKYDLMLRIYEDEIGWPKDSLIIARIQFVPERKGYGTHFLRWLTQIAEEFKLTTIWLERANPNAVAFGEKFGFHKSVKENMDLSALVDMSIETSSVPTLDS